MFSLNSHQIKNIKESFGGFIKTTPLQYSERLSKKYQASIYIKREDLTKVRSYKIRGAFNLINSLSKQEKQRGVVCASAGNHAQGVAISCNKLKIKGTIFMPVTTPEQKVYKTKQFGGNFVDVVLVGDTFDEALKHALDFKLKNNATFVHPFDDQRIIAGQATVGFEIFQQLGQKGLSPDYIICPVGGGGLVSGTILATQALSKNTKVIGVEPLGACGMKKSLEVGKNIKLDDIDVFVDGASVKKKGDLTFQICQNYGLNIVACPENRVCSTILEYLKEDGIVVEPAGALSTDALKDTKEMIKGKTVVVIISGGNFDFERLPEVKERSLKFEGLKRYFLVAFPQRPGALKLFLNCLGENDDIERFEYLKKSAKTTAPVFIGIKTDNPKNWDEICSKMSQLGFKYKDVTDDDLVFNILI